MPRFDPPIHNRSPGSSGGRHRSVLHHASRQHGRREDEMEGKKFPRWVGAAALVASGLVAGGVMASAGVAGAADSSGSSGSVAVAPIAAADDEDAAARRSGETLLTGATAEKVTAAAKK